MYYSKNTSSITVPQNYSGNTFRSIGKNDIDIEDEANEVSFNATDGNPHGEKKAAPPEEKEKKEEKPVSSAPGIPFLSSLLSSISLEDVLLLGLILVIHQENPNDTTLLLLLILLLAK